MKTCPHDVVGMDVAANADDLCPLCLWNENQRLRRGLQKLSEDDYDLRFSPEGYAQAILDGVEPAMDEERVR